METRRRGRPRIHRTEEDRVVAKQAAKKKFKNVALDADLVDAINTVADTMEPDLGFRPTLSQTVRHLIKTRKTR
jgi:hypothetical protein